MSVIASEVLWKYSTTSGSSNGSTTGTQAGSLGKYCSTVSIDSGQINSIFDDITAANNDDSTYYYKCVCLLNSNTSSALNTITVSLARASSVAAAADVAFGLDPAASTSTGIDYGGSSAFAYTTNVTTAPGSGPSWTAVSSGSVQSLSTFSLTANHFMPIWIRIQGNNTSATSETITLSWSGTAP